MIIVVSFICLLVILLLDDLIILEGGMSDDHEPQSQRLASRLLAPFFSVVVYNPLNLLQDRHRELANALKTADVIMVPGTQIRTTFGRSHSLDRSLRTHHFQLGIWVWYFHKQECRHCDPPQKKAVLTETCR